MNAFKTFKKFKTFKPLPELDFRRRSQEQLNFAALLSFDGSNDLNGVKRLNVLNERRSFYEPVQVVQNVETVQNVVGTRFRLERFERSVSG